MEIRSSATSPSKKQSQARQKVSTASQPVRESSMLVEAMTRLKEGSIKGMATFRPRTVIWMVNQQTVMSIR
jgi:hypothetical protein